MVDYLFGLLFIKTRGQLLDAWLALTIGSEVSKPIRFYGS